MSDYPILSSGTPPELAYSLLTAFISFQQHLKETKD